MPSPQTCGARRLRNNRSQAARIPAGFEWPGKRVLVRRDDDRLIFEPFCAKGLLGLLTRWDPLDEMSEASADPIPAPEDVL